MLEAQELTHLHKGDEYLEVVDEEQIMFPPEGHDPVDGPLFTREEARIIFGAVLRYHTETLYP